ncbi:response regulator [Aureisphaera galaxeae]|uniref:response regulator n=1 Tax=Aureisphaera galaxeae TaxID=1538023 RepID=UPI0023504E5E|nr:response regulator [Aureisphaera galaxeae]MDC8004740.1 response regulator [Aureisphaera galaxeae]
MRRNYKVLLIDDHPLITGAYKSALQFVSDESEEINFYIDTADNCDDGYEKIKDASENSHLDLIFLDLRLPPSKDNKILSGEDLGIIANKLMPDTKVIISTTFNDNYRIHSILKSVNPDGFLIKNDITPEEIVTAIKNVLFDPPYYSKSVLRLLRNEVSNDFLLDKIDRRLLYELSIGTKMKDLPDILPLSIAGIEKRKRHLKEVFDVSKSSDKDLILIAKEKGFI